MWNKMKKHILWILLAGMILCSCAGNEDRAVNRIVSGMSLEDRIGEMILLEFGQISYMPPEYNYQNLLKMSEDELGRLIEANALGGSFDAHSMSNALVMTDFATIYPYYLLSIALAKKGEVNIDREKAASLFGDYHITGLLNMIGGDEATPFETWRRVIADIDSASWAYGGKPCIYGLDQMHGTTYISDGTIFPHSLGIAATFNRDHARSMGEICSYESRAAGVRWIYGPVLDLSVRPTWSRNYETMGEDPYLVSELGAAYIRAMQGGDEKTRVGTCLKHYMGYSFPDNGIDRNPATISEADLMEKVFYPFKKAIEQGALSVMTNSSILNGESGVANKRLLNDLLKKGLDWDGVIVTDWADVDAMVTSQHTAADLDEAIEKAVNAGVDMIMVPSKLDYGERIASLVRSGRISKSRVRDAATRVVRLKYRLGLFDREAVNPEDYPLAGGSEFARKSYEATLESEVLLKNDGGVLPIREGSRILVCGPNANSMRTLHGGWTYTWQGSNAEKFTERYNTVLEALQNRFGKDKVDYYAGVQYDFAGNWKDDRLEVDDALLRRKAAAADVIVACVGENSYAETQGSIDDANLSENQKALVRKLAAYGKPVVLVLNGGRARIISDIEPLCSAVVDILLPGVYGGDALSALLSGDENFSGRLPYTYPLSPNSFTTYNYKVCENRETIAGIYNYGAHTNVQWWFGEGKSYTTFEYSDFTLDKPLFGARDELHFSVKVTNTGDRTGKEAVLLYVSDVSASVSPDNRRLRAFDKIELRSGESRTVEFTVKAEDLSFADSEGIMTLEPGDYVAMCGGQFIEFKGKDNWKEK